MSSASFLRFYAGCGGPETAGPLLDNLHRVLGAVRWGVPSFDPEHPDFDSVRYWRGPVWGIINYMIGRGLAEQGHHDLAERVRSDTAALIEQSGFNEYFCPLTAQGAGGGHFAWTAAIWLAWASPAKASRAETS